MLPLRPRVGGGVALGAPLALVLPLGVEWVRLVGEDVGVDVFELPALEVLMLMVAGCLYVPPVLVKFPVLCARECPPLFELRREFMEAELCVGDVVVGEVVYDETGRLSGGTPPERLGAKS